MNDQLNPPHQINRTFLEKLYPADIIALVVIIAGSWLTGNGDGESFGPLMIMVVSFYFGLKSNDPMSKVK